MWSFIIPMGLIGLQTARGGQHLSSQQILLAVPLRVPLDLVYGSRQLHTHSSLSVTCLDSVKSPRDCTSRLCLPLSHVGSRGHPPAAVCLPFAFACLEEAVFWLQECSWGTMPGAASHTHCCRGAASLRLCSSGCWQWYSVCTMAYCRYGRAPYMERGILGCATSILHFC